MDTQALEKALGWLERFVDRLPRNDFQSIATGLTTSHQLNVLAAGECWEDRVYSFLRDADRLDIEPIDRVLVREGIFTTHFLDHAALALRRFEYLARVLWTHGLSITLTNTDGVFLESNHRVLMVAYMATRIGIEVKPNLEAFLQDKRFLEYPTDPYFVAHRVFYASHYGEQTIPPGEMDEEKAYLEEYVEVCGPDLTGEIVWALTQFKDTPKALVKRGIERILSFQESNGSWHEDIPDDLVYEHGYHPDLLRWHTTLVCSSALLGAATACWAARR